MKKILYLSFMFLAIGLGFTACSDDDDQNPIHSEAAATVSAGEFTGTWQRVSSTDGSIVTAPGTMTLTSDGTSRNITNISVASEELSLEGSGIANISWADNGFVFYNVAAGDSAFASSFNGRINNDSITITFRKVVKLTKRSRAAADFTFKGIRK